MSGRRTTRSGKATAHSIGGRSDLCRQTFRSRPNLLSQRAALAACSLGSDRVGLAVAVGALPAAGTGLHAAGLDLDDETAAAGDHRERVELGLARRAAARALPGEAAVVVEDGVGRQRGEEVLEDGAFAVGRGGIEAAGDQARHQALTPARRRAASGTAAVISRIPSPRRGTPLRSDEPFGQRRLAACLHLPGGP